MRALFPLELKAAETARRGQRLVGPVDVRLEGAGCTVVIGPNGAGKTSLLRLMHGTARLTGGSLRWGCGEAEARQRQAFVFQQPVMLRRSVEENLAYPLRARGVARSEARAKARAWAERVGLGAMLGRQAPVLSGGERQKLALARALIIGPEVLFLDEPCAALDGAATRDIEAILREAKAGGTALVMATHDMGQARRLGDEVLFLLGGRVRERSPAKAFFEGPETAEARAFLRGDII